METNERIIKIINWRDSQMGHLECDGATRLIAFMLFSAGMEGFKIHIWQITNKRGSILIPYHMWIEKDEWIVDYKLNMWLEKKVPEGVFRKEDDKVVHITSTSFDYSELKMSRWIYEALTSN